MGMRLTACAQVTITLLYFNCIPYILELHPKVNNRRAFKKKKNFENEIESKGMRALDLIKEYNTKVKECSIKLECQN
jgi:hypothetical protein